MILKFLVKVGSRVAGGYIFKYVCFHKRQKYDFVKEVTVILLSTEYKDGKTDGENKNYEPHIILHYNKIKGKGYTT